MAEKVRVREREPGMRKAAGYWVSVERSKRNTARAHSGKIVIEGDEREWEPGPMGHTYRYIYEGLHDDTALGNWWVFANDIRRHSGAHRHAGGLVIYVVEGSGYSVVEGEKHEWEAGDLMLLPLQAGGVEHQHFNDGDEPARLVSVWSHHPANEFLGGIQHIEDASSWGKG